jgi:histidinol phosphatase-like enzyme (inositol monophosphatase family)
MAGESLGDLLQIAVELDEGAGKITLKYFQGRFDVETKADTSPVTVADREAEAHIRQTIESRFPDDGILGEEFGEIRPQARQRWIIDPIDGTFSFVRDVPLYGVLIGVEQDGEPVIGVIHLSALHETAGAAAEEGCHWRGQRARVSTTSALSDALWLATDLDFETSVVEAGALDRVVSAAGPGRTWGDCYGYVLVATGRADIMIDPAMHVWDCAPLLPIIEEAGGRFTDWQGRRTIQGGNAVATNGLLHDQVLELLHG